MYKELAELALDYALKLGAEYAEARLETHTSNSFLVKNGVTELANFDKTIGLGVRLVVNKTLGFMAINTLDTSEIKKLIEKSYRLTKASSKLKEGVEFSHNKSYKKTYEVREKIKLENLSIKEKLKILLDLEKEILKLKIKVPGRFLSFTDDLVEKYYINSEGSRISSKIPFLNLFYYLTVQNNNNSMQRYWQYGNTGGYESLKKWNLNENIINEIKAMQNTLKYGKKVPTHNLDVITSPEVTGIAVHESGGHPYEADRIFGREAAQAGESFISEKMIGKRIGSDVVNLVDDPTLPNSYGFYLYDDEGVKARRKYLIKNGLITEFLHNRSTAATMNLKSNGSARANNYDKEVLIRMSNTFMMPGDYTKEELFEEVKNGIYIKSFTEWNIDDLRLNQRYVGNEAYLIKNGKILYPLRNPTIEINTPALYKSVAALSKEMEFHAASCGKGEPMQGIPVWHGGAYMLLKNIKVH